MRHILVMASLALAACSGQGPSEQQEPGVPVASEPKPTTGSTVASPSNGAAAVDESPSPATNGAASKDEISAETPTEAPFAHLGAPRATAAAAVTNTSELVGFEDSANTTVEVIKAEYSPVWAEERRSFRVMEEAAR